MTLAEAQTRDFLGIIEDAPQNFWFGLTEYEGTRGGIGKTARNMEGGYLEEPDLILTTTLNYFQAGQLVVRFPEGAPAVDGVITVDGQQYRVEKVTTDELGVAIQFDLVSKHKETR